MTINYILRDFETKILREKASEFLLFLINKEKGLLHNSFQEENC